MRSSRPRVGLIIRRTILERHLERPTERMTELLDRCDATVATVRAAHDEHGATVAEVREQLGELGAEVAMIRRFRSGFDAAAFDLVVTVGGDGTLLRASHSVGSTPVLAVNSAPSFSVGFFCGARSGNVAKVLRAALGGELPRVTLTRMQVTINGALLSARVLNDALLCHQSPAATSRYIIEHAGLSEEQKSSGLWIGPAAGSTAAQRSAGGKVLPLASRKLQLVVRDPYITVGRQYRIRRLIIKPGGSLRVRSKSPHMRIYLDGPDQVERVDRGDEVVFTESSEPLTVLGLRRPDR